MAKFNTGVSFTDGNTVTGADLNNITSQLNIKAGVISEQTAMSATVSTADQLLIADTDNGDSGAANRVTIQKLLNDTLTNGTYTNAQLSGNLSVAQLSTLGTLNNTSGTIGILNSTTGTIAGLRSTTGTITTLTAGTTTSTAANITNGTVQTLTASTADITSGTYSGVINSSTGTYSGLINSSTGTYSGTVNSSLGTIGTGTIGTLNSTTGTITNLTTTLTGDLTISTGSATVGTRVAVVDTAQEYTATHNFNATTLTSGASIAWALPSNQVSRLVLSTNGTMADPTGKVDGATYMLIVTQGTGSNTLSWNATYKFPGAITPTLTTGSGVSDIFTFVSNGTSMFGVASQNYAA